jgi:hypothetical protein
MSVRLEDKDGAVRTLVEVPLMSLTNPALAQGCSWGSLELCKKCVTLMNCDEKWSFPNVKPTFTNIFPAKLVG